MVKAKKSAKTKVAETTPDSKAMESPERINESAEIQKTVINTTADYFPIVGIGASAGGLAAFEEFFSGMPADTDPGMAFVLVQHLAPDHKSILTDLIKRYTRMQVFEVEDGMEVKPNCTYIIPPGRNMALFNGRLQLLEPSAPRGQRLPIDFFFRSLAQDQGERAICIVLSGTGSDGTQGARAIKAEGGMVIAQKTESTEYDGMPRSAIATGLVDYELLPVAMPAQLIAYTAHAFGTLPRPATPQTPQAENALQKIFTLLRAQTGHDFSQYKTSTVLRRIERRLAVHQFESIDRYVTFLQQEPTEVEALLRDLLIGVTNFFRDPEAFKKLEEQVIPKLFTSKPAGAAIRVWSIGCSTGEEAYSIAILLLERMAVLKQSYNVQIFASDIDRQAIATARAGTYPASIAADLSPDRLARFFTVEHDGSSYRIHKNIRDMLVFSEHNAIKDPPFSRLDLISCRNLLIYMGKDLQKKLIPLFHYALNTEGFLFLGSSETIGEYSELFSTLDRKLKLYQRKKNFQGGLHASWGRFLPPMTTMDGKTASGVGKTTAGKLSPRELTERVFLQQLAPTGALVNSKGDILYLHGRAGMYLEPATGEVSVYNILKMARTGLRHELTTALHKATETRKIVSCTELRVQTNGDFTTVNLTIHPVIAGSTASSEAPLYLVILEEAAAYGSKPTQKAGAGTGKPGSPATLSASVQIAALRQELRAKEEYLKATNEELETSNEELKSSNEEMQSVNEELATVNTELQTKVTDLSRANNDMNNLLAGTGIATVFVDHGLHILRFTPSATQIINLIQSDVGRPVGHTVTNLVGYDHLVTDVQAVLNTLVPYETDVQTADGRWYTMRILPYRTIDNVIEGAVITFVDITVVKNMQEMLRKTNTLNRLVVVARDALDGMTVQDLEGRILAWNPAAERMYGWSESEALNMNIRDLIPMELQEESLAKIEQLSRAGSLKSYRTQRRAKDGTIRDVWMTASALVNEEGQIFAIATTERVNGVKFW